jgi:hypothetical protein
MDVKHIQAAPVFLEIPHPEWRVVIEHTVLASVKAFSFLHHVCFAARSGNDYSSVLRCEFGKADDKKKSSDARGDNDEEGSGNECQDRSYPCANGWGLARLTSCTHTHKLALIPKKA